MRLPRWWQDLASVALALATLGGCAAVPPVAPNAPVAAVAPAAPAASRARVVPERVSFDSLDRDPATGAPVRLAGLLFRPATSGEARHPAVVAFHGCGGMYSVVASRREMLSLRHQAMGELLAAEGYAVLFPDSFRSRGLEEICTIPFRQSPITSTHRLLDAQGALAYLQSRADVAPERIAALGWSHGGITVLAAENAKQPAVVQWKERPGGAPYFRAAVAFYPGCIDSLRARGGYAVSAPLLLFVAGSDDWTAPQPCIDLADRFRPPSRGCATGRPGSRPPSSCRK